MTGSAQHRKEDVYIVWGENPICVLCRQRRADDLDHCCGRGGKRNRKIHSSILNCAPLCRVCHTGKNGYIKGELLRIAKKSVDSSLYEYKALDHDFMNKYSLYYE